MKFNQVFLILLSCLCVSGCEVKLKHIIPETISIELQIGIDDLCLTCLPVCTQDGYHCESPVMDPNVNEELKCDSCSVGCLGGSAIACMPDGSVMCSINLIGSEVEVPTICVRNDIGILEDPSTGRTMEIKTAHDLDPYLENY